MSRELERKDQHTLVCIHSPPVSDEWVAYTDYIGGLLNSRPIYQSCLEQSDYHQSVTSARELPDDYPQEPLCSTGGAWADIYDDTPDVHLPDFSLVTIADSKPLWWQRLLWRQPAYRALKELPGSILFARGPRWPLRHILLVIRVDDSDGLSLAWAERLALLSGAKVKILPIVPPWSRLHQHDSKIQLGLEVLMAPNTISGEAIHRYARRLDQLSIHGTVCWRHGSLEEQLHLEAQDNGHDLIIIADEPFGPWSRWFVGDLVGLLLRVSERPILVVR